MEKKGYILQPNVKKKYKVKLIDGTVFVKELIPGTVRTYIRSTPGIASIVPEEYKSKH